MYDYEKGTNVYSGRPTTWNGKVALMYISDYGFATSGGSTTNRISCLSKELFNWADYDVQDCKNNDWLLDESSWQWALNPYSASSDGAFFVYTSGYVYNRPTYDARDIRPSVFLKSSVVITGGDGSQNSPFVLSLS